MATKKVIAESVADSEKEELKKQLEEMQKQMTFLMSKLNENSKVSTDETDDLNEVKISSDEYIKVMSLCPMVLNLTTMNHGKGKVFTFSKFGEVKRILYGDLTNIMENHNNFLEQGFFIILNRNVVRKHGLDDIYAKILTKDKMEIVLTGNQSDAVNLFKSANEKQREFIVRIIVDKAIAGEEMDLNLLDRLSRVIGYNIQEKIEDIKALNTTN